MRFKILSMIKEKEEVDQEKFKKYYDFKINSN